MTGVRMSFFADDRSPKVYELAVDTVVSLLFQNDVTAATCSSTRRIAVKGRVKMRELQGILHF